MAELTQPLINTLEDVASLDVWGTQCLTDS